MPPHQATQLEILQRAHLPEAAAEQQQEVFLGVILIHVPTISTFSTNYNWQLGWQKVAMSTCPRASPG